MSAAHLSATFTKELERRAYDELPDGIDRERIRHEVAICGAGGQVRNLIFVARLVLNRITNGAKKAPYPMPPDVPEAEFHHLERCAERVLAVLADDLKAAA